MRSIPMCLLLGLGLALGACKETDRLFETEGGPSAGEGGTEDGGVIKARKAKAKEFAASAASLKKNAQFFFKIWDETFTLTFDDLPNAGEVPDEQTPNSGYWYPESQGGTNIRVSGNRTPLQKFDDAFNGGQPLATNWEAEKHSSPVSWAGHCNGFSAAGQRHPEEPSRNVEKNGVTFTPQDIKALLAEVYMSADYEFLGGNRCEARTVRNPLQREDPTELDECEDINPGTLHAAITNWIGRMKHTLIMDQYTGDEVWNFPFFKYEILEAEKGLTASEARQYVVGGGGGDYVFNPAAESFVRVVTRLTYIHSSNGEQLGQRSTGFFLLNYVLELDGEGNILGGEWIGESRANHPDFLWVALPPMEPNGTRFMGNPHLDATEVIKLWALATGNDPENPPTDITRPEAISDWGKWPNFEVVLDGGRRGAVFGGKDVAVEIQRREGLADGAVELELALNGKTVTTLKGAAGKNLSYAFAPGPGFNLFRFIWKKGGQVLQDESLPFHVVR